MIAMICFLLTGCGSDSPSKALEQFANKDMAKVNVAYTEFARNYATSLSYINDTDKYVTYVNTTLLTELDDIAKQVDEIETDEPEITDLKKKYSKVISGYHSALDNCAKAVAADDSEALAKGNEEIVAVSKDLDAYNTALKKLAKKYKMEVKDVE